MIIFCFSKRLGFCKWFMLQQNEIHILCVLQREIYWLIIGISSRAYEGQEIPESAISKFCKLKIQESWWSNSAWVHRLESQKHRCPKGGEAGWPCLSREDIFPSCIFLFSLGPQQIVAVAGTFPQSTNLNFNLSRNILTATARKNVYQLFGCPFVHSNWHIKLTIITFN